MMTRRDWLGAACAATGVAASRSRQDRPNLVLVVADDLGYGDLACYGSQPARTPNLDRLAREGLRFTSCYAAHAVCSPARAGLMTGRIPARSGIQKAIPALSPMHLRREETTVATLLRRAGYATCHIGKWHMNGVFNSPEQPQPGDHGFEYWFSTQNNALPNHRNPDNFVRNGVPAGVQQGYAGQIVAGEAIDWLKNIRDRNKPFFQYICFHEPHEPIRTEDRFAGVYPSQDPSYSAYYGNITQMDDAVGRVMRALDEMNLRDSTLVLFVSDNGPARTPMHPHGSAGPFRGKKSDLYEGGIRVPGILRWPGKARPGTVSEEPISGVDWLPTVCDITGIPLPSGRAIDGASWLPVLQGKAVRRRTPLYWHFNQANSKPKVAMRIGDWKILARLTGPEIRVAADIKAEEQQAIKSAELERFELYDLRHDEGETRDLAAQETGRLNQMAEAVRKLYREVRDEGPVWPAWKSPRYEEERIVWPPYWKPPARR
jgi:arylsulfatase A